MQTDMELIEVTIKDFVLNCTEVNPKKRAKLSSKISSVLFNQLANPLCLRSLIQFALRWDTTKNRARFLSDAIVRTPYIWVGKIFAIHGITDPDKPWQTKRANLLLHAERDNQPTVSHPPVTTLTLTNSRVSIDDYETSSQEKVSIDLSNIDSLETTIRLFLQICQTEYFVISNNFVLLQFKGVCKNNEIEFLTHLSRISFVLPTTIAVIVEDIQDLAKLFESPSLDGSALFWFHKHQGRYKCISVPKDASARIRDEPLMSLNVAGIIDLMNRYYLDVLTANVPSKNARRAIQRYIELEHQSARANKHEDPKH